MNSPVAHPVADRCPGLLRPHRAEDGLLVRIRVPGGQTDAATLLALSALAQRHGNDDLQLTSRGNLQIRGLADADLDALSGAVAALGLLPSAAHERVRNVVASPLTGLDAERADLRPLVAELDDRICASPVLERLPGRFLFALDDGSADVLGLAADLTYLARDPENGLLLTGDRGVPVRADEAAAALVLAAERFVAQAEAAEHPVWHVTELPNPLLAGSSSQVLPDPGPVTLGALAGAASVAVPLGLLTPAQARTVAAVADRVVITPWRGLVLPGAGAALPALVAAGLVGDARSPWSSLTACVGAPGCGQARISTRDRATELAAALGEDATRTPVHVSGCERRCGAPTGAYADLVAPPDLASALALLEPEPARPTPRYDYVADGAEIYVRSFATIRDEADLSRLPADARTLAVRMIHAAGDVDLTSAIALHPRLVGAARAALDAGAPIFTDSQMLASGVTRRRLPAGNDVRCLLNDPRTAGLAQRWSTTRSAAAVSLWGPELEGAVVAVGNAPTALFHLLELIADGGPRPAAIIGIPVGFVGSAESKVALAENPWDLPYLVVHGRRGGSAICAAAINALATEAEIA